MHRSWMTVPAFAAGVLLLAGTPAFASVPDAPERTAVIYDVVQDGMTADQAKRLAATYGIESALMEDGGFSYFGKEYGAVPQKVVGQSKDEAGRPVTSQALDTAALARLRPLSDDAALKRAGALPALAGVTGDLRATPRVSNSELETSDNEGKRTGKYLLDTSVSYDLSLGGLPVSGQGAKLRMTLAADGSVTQVTSLVRQLAPGKRVEILSPDAAAKACDALYADDVRQDAPTLGYVFPALGGGVKQIYPSYTCNPLGGEGAQAHFQVPAVDGSAPKATFKAQLRDGIVTGEASAEGGTAPYSYKWSSSTTALDDNDAQKIAYKRTPREGKLTGEGLTLQVTDANGISSTAAAAFAGDGAISGESTPGGGGFGKLAIGPTDVAAENTVDEWQCAVDSAKGFRQRMAASGIPTAFEYHGMSAWEEDFKKASAGGTDSNYADNVDAMWYTGHGGPNGFTFKNTTHDDDRISPSDADWGNGDLEWLNLESCQVLKDTNGNMDQLTRWGGAINGLHMMNGFHTNAYCIDGGTGRAFADYMLGTWYLPAQPVRVAWAAMAYAKEPSGVRFRSIGNIGPGGVTNISDYFWGKGPTGPDISKASRTGMWSLSGLV